MKIIVCTFLILYKRMKYNYGADDRPELYEERANMKITDEVKMKWEKEGVKIL